eukprot:2924327-Rhodomonas_salina.4
MNARYLVVAVRVRAVLGRERVEVVCTSTRSLSTVSGTSLRRTSILMFCTAPGTRILPRTMMLTRSTASATIVGRHHTRTLISPLSTASGTRICRTSRRVLSTTTRTLSRPPPETKITVQPYTPATATAVLAGVSGYAEAHTGHLRERILVRE